MPVMRPTLLSLVLASALAAVAPAQTSEPSAVSLGITGGESVPTGSGRDSYRNGFQFSGLAEVRTPVSWIAIRIDGGYQGLAVKPLEGFDPVTNTTVTSTPLASRLFSGTVNLALRAPHLQTAIRPYALLGFGRYWLDQGHPPGIGQNTILGMNGPDAALGLEAPLTRAVIFVEARYQRLPYASLRFVPISVGLRLP